MTIWGRIGGMVALARQDPIWLRRTLVHSTRGRTLELPLSKPMLGLSRYQLNSYLLETARGAGATVLQPFRCESTSTDGNGISGAPPAGVVTSGDHESDPNRED